MLTDFQRWVIRRYYEFSPWPDYKKKLAVEQGDQPSLGFDHLVTSITT